MPAKVQVSNEASTVEVFETDPLGVGLDWDWECQTCGEKGSAGNGSEFGDDEDAVQDAIVHVENRCPGQPR
jgi:hypothetical protein